MKLGLVGLGRMGAGIAERLRRGGHEVVGYDRNPAVSQVAVARRSWSRALPAPRVVWVMVPAGDPTQATIDELASPAERGRHHHRRRQQLLQRLACGARGAEASGASASSTPARPAASGA